MAPRQRARANAVYAVRADNHKGSTASGLLIPAAAFDKLQSVP
jgi:hypothetical protein